MTEQVPDQPQSHDDPLSGDGAALPSDRDEKPSSPTENAQHRQNRQVIEQGRRDVESGLEDTERIGTPNTLPSSGDGDPQKR